jgi:hypothetical protein
MSPAGQEKVHDVASNKADSETRLMFRIEVMPLSFRLRFKTLRRRSFFPAKIVTQKKEGSVNLLNLQLRNLSYLQKRIKE